MESKFQNIRHAIGIVLIALPVLCNSTTAISADENSLKIEETRTALEKWVETKRVISKEKHDLALAKEILNERIQLVQNEIESLRSKIKDVEINIAEVDKTFNEMMEVKENLKKTSESFGNSLISLENRTKLLLKRLPEPIQDRVKPLSQRIPENPEKSLLSISERFQNIIGILNEVNLFSRKINVTSEVRTLLDGTSAEVTVFYVGIGQAYYTNTNGTVAGIGIASDEGWIWKPYNEAAEQIKKAIAVLQNEQPASFVYLPIEIQ